MTDDDMTVCPSCGTECTGIWADFGIGAYEYWGARGVHTLMRFVSDCCEAELPSDQ